ncbi:hypothetical protein JHK85_012499 [Glycine max]|nr:hypothetical protein JHK85_012499 [Glycine max]
MLLSIVASESAFSIGGRVLDPFRSSLSHEKPEALICTQDWLKDTPSAPFLDFDLEELQSFDKLAPGSMHSPSNRQLDSTKPPGHDQTDLTDQIGPILKHWHHHSIVTTITMTIPPLLPPSLSPLFHPYHYRHLHTTIPPTPPPPALGMV